MPVVNGGSKGKPLYVPAKICRVDPHTLRQTFSGKITKEGERILSKHSRAPGAVTQVIRKQAHNALGFSNMMAMLKTFGVDIASGLLPVTGRVLDAPAISFASRPWIIKNGSWSTRDAKLTKPANSSFRKAAILVIRGTESSKEDAFFTDMGDDNLRKASSAFQLALAAKGVDVDTEATMRTVLVEVPTIRDGASTEFAAEIIENDGIGYLTQSDELHMLFAVLSKHDAHIYPIVKGVCDERLGIPSACIDTLTVKRVFEDSRKKVESGKGKGASEDEEEAFVSCLARHPALVNVALKANAKAGGINQEVNFDSFELLREAMVVGFHIDKMKGSLNKLRIR